MPQGSYTAVAIAGPPWEKMSDRAKEKYIESSFYGDLVDLNPEAKKAWRKIESKARDIARRGGDPHDWLGELPEGIRNQADFGEQWLAANPDNPVVPELRQRKDPFVKTIVNNGSFLSRIASKVGPRVVAALATAGISEGLGAAQGASDAVGFNPIATVGQKAFGDLLTGNPVDPNATQGHQPAKVSNNKLPDFAKVLLDEVISSKITGKINDTTVDNPTNNKDEEFDSILNTVLGKIDNILRDATPPGKGPEILDPAKPPSIFDEKLPPPSIDDIATAKGDNIPGNDGEGGSIFLPLPTGVNTTNDPPEDPPFVPPFIPTNTGGVLDDPTQPPEDTGEEKDNTALLALLVALGGNFGTTSKVNKTDPNPKPNIPHPSFNPDNTSVFGDFDVPVHLPRLSLEKFRGKKLALPDFMT